MYEENEKTPVLEKETKNPPKRSLKLSSWCYAFFKSRYWAISPILMVILSHNFTCSSVAPVFSVFADEVHASWSKTYTGCVIGSFDSGNMISSFVIGSLLAKYLKGHLYRVLIAATFISGIIRLLIVCLVFPQEKIETNHTPYKAPMSHLLISFYKAVKTFRR